MENKDPKDPIEEGMPPLDLEDNGYYVDNEDFAIDDLYPEDDQEMDYYDSLDDELEDDEDDYYGLDDIFDDLEGLDESDLY